ncbi:MAG TPA: hypothetical protein PKW49_12860, partial [Paludibacteraceae bacterium]|nr:hypothetical protein [Paludibacteraceae bacterium]
GEKEVMEEAPFVAVEIVHEGDHLVIVQSLIPQPLADMRPVFLFDVGVVVFVIGPAACKVYGLFSLGEMTKKVIIEKLTAIV